MPILEREIGAKLSEIRLDYPPLNKEVIQDVRNLWEDPSIQETYLWKCAASSWLCRVLHGESGPISWSRLRTNKGAHRRGRAWPNWRLFHGEGKLGQRHATTRVATVRGHHHLIKCPLTMARCCSFPLHCHWRNYSCRFKPLWSSPVIWQWYQHINSFSSSSVHSIQLSVQVVHQWSSLLKGILFVSDLELLMCWQNMISRNWTSPIHQRIYSICQRDDDIYAYCFLIKNLRGTPHRALIQGTPNVIYDQRKNFCMDSMKPRSIFRTRERADYRSVFRRRKTAVVQLFSRLSMLCAQFKFEPSYFIFFVVDSLLPISVH